MSNEASVQIRNCRFVNNTQFLSAGGAVYFGTRDVLKIEIIFFNVTFKGNYA
jgi:hypothetical protein